MKTDRDATSTLVGNERRFAPVVLAVHCACATAGLLALARVAVCNALRPTVPATPVLVAALLPCLFAWTLLTCSNVRYLLQHDVPTVGMIPPSVVSLGPAALPALVAQAAGVASDEASLVALHAAALLASVATAAFMAWWFMRLRSAYSPAPPVAPDAVVFVLGGAVRDDAPGATLALRLQTAWQVWQRHPQATLVLSGGTPQGTGASEADVMARFLKEKGVPEAALLLETHALNTRENLLLSLELANEAGLGGQRCVLSSDYHLYRACRIARQLGAEFVPIPAPTPAASLLQQWCREVITVLVT